MMRPSPPPRLPPRGSDIPQWLVQVIAWGGAAAHALFLAVFTWQGWTLLAWLNVASVLVYLGVAWALRTPRHQRAAALLAIGEIVVHAVVATLWLGWGSGFHLYLLCLSPVVFVGTGLRMPAKWACMAALALCYLALRYLTLQHGPQHDVAGNTLHALEYLNIAGVVLLLSLGSYMYASTVLRVQRRLLQLAHTDPLTGLSNRRRWLDIAQRAHHSLCEGGPTFAVLLCDLDHFKAINDRYGHAGGDDALRSLGRSLGDALHGDALVSRWGGEEFAVLLPGMRQREALHLAQDLRHRVHTLELQLDGQAARLSMTLGVAEAHAGESLHELLRRADAALYRGKQAGRNRVEPAEPPAVQPMP